MKKGAIGAIVGVLLLALLGAGCGSDSEETLTKAQYVKKANAICKRGGEARSDAIVAFGEKIKSAEPTQKQKEELVAAALAPYEEMTAELAELPAPKGDEKQIEVLIEKFEAPIEQIEADPNIAIKNPALFGEGNDLAEKYGLDECLI